jgi:hypothetical protein
MVEVTLPAGRPSVILLQTSREAALHQKWLPTDGYGVLPQRECGRARRSSTSVDGYGKQKALAVRGEVEGRVSGSASYRRIVWLVMIRSSVEQRQPCCKHEVALDPNQSGHTRRKCWEYVGKRDTRGQATQSSSSSTQNNQGSPGLARSALSMVWLSAVQVLACAEETKRLAHPCGG